MLDFLKPDFIHPTPQQVGRYFRWFGWTGFWLQTLLGLIPVLVLIVTVLSRGGAVSFGLFLAMLGAVLLCFSIYWCFRYIQIGNNLMRPESRPSKASVLRDLRLGVTVNFGIMILAVLIALWRVAELTIRMLMLPPGARVIESTQVGGTAVAPGAFITPSNMIALQAMVNTIAAGLVGAIVAFTLLYVVRQHRNMDEF